MFFSDVSANLYKATKARGRKKIRLQKYDQNFRRLLCQNYEVDKQFSKDTPGVKSKIIFLIPTVDYLPLTLHCVPYKEKEGLAMAACYAILIGLK